MSTPRAPASTRARSKRGPASRDIRRPTPEDGKARAVRGLGSPYLRARLGFFPGVPVGRLWVFDPSAAGLGATTEQSTEEADIQYQVTRLLYRPLSTRVAGLLSSTSISPTTVTWISAAAALAGAGLFAAGYYAVGAIVTFVAMIADCADGDLARATGRSSKVGAFLDSVLDRWTDAALVIGLMYSDLATFGGVGVLALTASLLTSYTRARAQSLGVDCPEGIGGRDSRILILVVGALMGAVWWALALVAITGALTSVQRAYLAAKRLDEIS